MICKHILLIAFLNKPELIFCSQLSSFKYFYQTQIILFTINHLFTQLDDFKCISNNSTSVICLITFE